MDLTSRVGWRGLNLFGSEQGEVTDSCENCNETSGFITCMKFPDWLLRKDEAVLN
jgi:hypothetical protein